MSSDIDACYVINTKPRDSLSIIENFEQLFSSVFSLAIYSEYENPLQEFTINKVKEFFNG